jgi:hypothetical protein
MWLRISLQIFARRQKIEEPKTEFECLQTCIALRSARHVRSLLVQIGFRDVLFLGMLFSPIAQLGLT